MLMPVDRFPTLIGRMLDLDFVIIKPPQKQKRLTIKSQPQKMNGGGEKEMEQKGYSKAETLSGPCWLFE